MMNIFRIRKSTALMARITGSTPSEDYEVVGDDLSTWELVNASLSDDEDRYSFDGDDVSSNGDDSIVVEDVLIIGGERVIGSEDGDRVIGRVGGVIGHESEPTTESKGEGNQDACESLELGVPDAVTLLRATWMQPAITFPHAHQCDGPGYEYDNEYARESRDLWAPDVYHYYDDEEEEHVLDHDVDDDLRPWKLKGKFDQKQRMGKMAKKSKPKPNKSHRNALPLYFQNRPGCLAGKRRVGVQRW